MGSMRVLLVTPLPRWYLLTCKLFAGVLVAVLQVYVFLLIAWLWGIEAPAIGYVAVLPALLVAGFMLGALGLLLSSVIRQLENFAGVMNFIIFPMFFASSALYPLWRIRESSVLLWQIASANPFTHAVELIRFALYGQLDPVSLAATLGCAALFFGLAVLGYNPARGFMARKSAGGGE
jgi:ABC-2 type transport system permease protein